MRIINYMVINGQTEVLGLIGNPVRHTKSPQIHNFISEKLNRNMIYVPYEVTGDIDTAVKGAYELGIKGLNVTVPYKTDVIKFLVSIDGLAAEIGAVNTLVRCEGGYRGYNTDMLGLERAVLSAGIRPDGMCAVILGAGGAARAAAYMCAKNKVRKLYILNRTIDKADAIARDIKRYISDINNISCNGNVSYGRTGDAADDNAGDNIINKTNDANVTEVVALPIDEYSKITDNNILVFQCTSIGLKDTDGCVIEDEAFYKKVSYGVDLIYREGTLFTKLVDLSGGKSINGKNMLIYQGVIAYELWNDIKIPDEIVNEISDVI